MVFAKKGIALVVTVMMAATCFGVLGAQPAYAAKKVTSITLTNVDSSYTIQAGKTKKLKYSIQAKNKYKIIKK